MFAKTWLSLVNHKQVQCLMRIMGLQAIYPKKQPQTKGSEHQIHPYLLEQTDLVRANQVWSTDYRKILVIFENYENVPQLVDGLKKYFSFYNPERPHRGLDQRTPHEVHFS